MNTVYGSQLYTSVEGNELIQDHAAGHREYLAVAA